MTFYFLKDGAGGSGGDWAPTIWEPPAGSAEFVHEDKSPMVLPTNEAEEGKGKGKAKREGSGEEKTTELATAEIGEVGRRGSGVKPPKKRRLSSRELMKQNQTSSTEVTATTGEAKI